MPIHILTLIRTPIQIPIIPIQYNCVMMSYNRLNDIPNQVEANSYWKYLSPQ